MTGRRTAVVVLGVHVSPRGSTNVPSVSARLLRAARIDRHLTREQLAVRADISVSAETRYEQGRTIRASTPPRRWPRPSASRSGT